MASSNIQCELCKSDDDLQTFSAQLTEKIKDWQNLKNVNVNLHHEAALQYEVWLKDYRMELIA